jgi:hypothetical protein
VSTVTPWELTQRVRQRTGQRMKTAFTRELLADWQARGIAEERLGRWSLTERGRAMFSGWVAVPDEAAA